MDDEYHVEIGNEFIIVIPKFGTAGYILEEEILPGGIEKIAQDRIAPIGDVIGGATQIKNTYRCTTAGDYQIEYHQKRPWSGEEHVTI